MSKHVGYVVEVKNIKPHPNADRMKIATFFSNETCINIDTPKGEIGIYFPSDLQLSVEYCDENHLCRTDKDGNPDSGYLDRNKRNVQAIKLRGYKSDGIYMPLKSLEYTGIDLSELRPGDIIENINGHEICCKYIPNKPIKTNNLKNGNKVRKKELPIAPLFMEHADTEQLAYNLEVFQPGDEIEITLKMHGTSQRTGYLPVLKGFKKSILDIIFKKEGKPIYDWGYVTGTRRTICGSDFEGGYYGSNKFREVHAKFFEGKLWKGEEVFYEVVGYTDSGTSIMGECNNKKLNDKEFVKQYGDTTVFSYGCEVGESDIYVYRMTMTNEDGDIVEYTPDFMRYRCEQMGVKTVPIFYKGILPEVENVGEDFVLPLAKEYEDGVDPIGKTHVREGVIVRIINKPKFCAFKSKNWYFKALEGIIKVEAETPDMEEAEDIL